MNERDKIVIFFVYRRSLQGEKAYLTDFFLLLFAAYQPVIKNRINESPIDKHTFNLNE